MSSQPSKPRNKRRLVVIGILFGLFVILNVVQFPRGPFFDCSPGNRGGYRLQYGFPFVVVQRSVPTTACSWPGINTTTADEIGNYNTHHVIPAALIGNVLVWSAAGLLLVRLIDHPKSKKLY